MIISVTLLCTSCLKYSSSLDELVFVIRYFMLNCNLDCSLKWFILKVISNIFSHKSDLSYKSMAMLLVFLALWLVFRKTMHFFIMHLIHDISLFAKTLLMLIVCYKMIGVIPSLQVFLFLYLMNLWNGKIECMEDSSYYCAQVGIVLQWFPSFALANIFPPLFSHSVM